MPLPDAIAAFEKQGDRIVRQNGIKEIFFSGSSYQVKVQEEKKVFWPFLLFNQEGEIEDYFCTCELSDQEKGCPHLAATLLYIFGEHKTPLHERYESSFWKTLFEIVAKEVGFEEKKYKVEKNRVLRLSTLPPKWFQLTALTSKGKKAIQTLSQDYKNKENQSFKISALSDEEQQLYNEGNPSFSVKFELSLWGDLAKFFFLRQERKESYTLSMDEEAGMPHRIFTSFEDMQFSSTISKEDWPYIIPALVTVDSPYFVKFDQEGVEHIEYMSEEEAFKIFFKDVDERKRKGKQIGEWIYQSKEGFYKESDLPDILKEKIPKEEMPKALSEHTDTFARYLKNASVHSLPNPLRYHLFFDKENKLHIKAYLFHKGDMDGALFIPPWVYLPDQQGFYKIEEVHFPEKEIIVPKEDISAFVARNRIFLHDFHGFQAHFGAIESEIGYKVSEKGDLEFFPKISFGDKEHITDFGDWLFVKGEGFFPKQEKAELDFLRNEKKILRENVSGFLTNYYSNLQLVPHLFTNRSPFEKVGLNLTIDENRKIVVEPIFICHEGFSKEQLIFYGDYVYLKNEGFFLLPGNQRIPENYQQKTTIPFSKELFFLQYEMEKLQPFLLHVDDRIKKPSFLQLHLKKLEIEKKQKRMVLLADFCYRSEIGEVELFPLWEKIASKAKVFFSDAGSLILKEDKFHWVKALPKRKFHRTKRSLKLTLAEWLRLSIWEKISFPPIESEEGKKAAEIIQRFSSTEKLPPFDLSSLQSRLRPYQELGFSWLWYLYCYGLSGLLCDDMGLGKTHQAMALLAAVKKEDPKYKFLVICPTSVIYHWQDLLAKFLPSLRVLIYHGTERKIANFARDYDLLLTSYGILRTGREKIDEIPFEIAIFDEIQIAKNPKSQTNRYLREMRAKMRLGLTGTPVENHLIELKAIFDVILPNYFPTMNVFKELFINPIEKENNQEKKELLKRLVKPFVLRRKKREVLQDLPEKTEEISYCDLSVEQRALYKEIAESYQKQILSSLKDEKEDIPYLHIFTLLGKLKQVCDHPSLIHKDLKNFQDHESGKFELFRHLLSEARDSNQKVVVFSQYLDMLHILERYLRKEKIGYSILTGETKKRREAIEKFHQDPSCEVFLASLLAAGVGIDLTVGSVVIHYDRWWNPAKENQATDRVHRIGQSRGVQVFKLVSKNTIEEEIHTLIERKKHLIEETIGRDDMDQIKTLSREELREIIEKTTIEKTNKTF